MNDFARLQEGLVELRARFRRLSDESYSVMKAIEICETAARDPTRRKVTIGLEAIEQIKAADHPSLDITKESEVAES
jgi:hypothetical protein